MKKLIFILALSCTAFGLFAQPANDNPCGATALTVGTSCTYVSKTTAGATNTGGVPAPPCATSGKDVWFSMTVPASGSFTIQTTAGTITDGVMAVYTGPCTDLTYATCNDDDGDLMPSLDCDGYIPGSTIYIRFYKKGGGTGSFNICVWDDNPPLAANNDCNTAQQLCTEATFTANSTSNGDVDDIDAANKGCLNPNEHQTSWYYVTFTQDGEWDLSITPVSPSDNYNFAIWGPDETCPLTGPPIRCSASNTTGTTGMTTTEVDVSEGGGGNGYTKFIDVDSGDTYLIMIDNYSESGSGFTLDFDGPPTIGCIDYLLPVTLTSFTGYNAGSVNILNWITESEVNNAWFEVQRSDNGNNFSTIGKISGAGTSSQSHEYTFTDNYPLYGNSYYRLKQVDLNGEFDYSDVIFVTNLRASSFTVNPNPTTGIIYINHYESAGTDYSIEIITATGSKYMSLNFTAETDYVQDKIAIPQAGIYWVVIRNSNGATSSKVVVQ